ncbi:single-stranded DNA-binding protein [Fulvivirgaceae bacterium BMA12]|uniref:Single-stranded DNA-binding protein n=1 Tax=Agaribacillus aureus TaxID=3051825 RepID=A0ABT8KZ80_9BACT|nr:single-stranded DNA-binding protein [Fulvivirgaceae bacterium BMA12]
MEAKVFASGNLESNAAIVYFKNGNAIIQFSIATSNYYHNQHGEVIQQPTGHDCLLDATDKSYEAIIISVRFFSKWSKVKPLQQ